MDPVTQVTDSLAILGLSEANAAKPEAAHTRLAYEPIPTDDDRILRVLKLAPGTPREALVGTLELVVGVGNSNEVRPPSESLRSLGVSQAIAETVWVASEAEAKSPKNEPSEPAAFIEYEALSYVWGDPAKTESMTLNGVTFGLSANLKDALINLRERDTERTLWVDALCINQDDETEKHREVMRMRAIYYSAKRVVVWLGDAVFDSNMAIEWAEQIHLHFKAYLTRLGVQDEGEGIFDWIRETQRFQMVEAFGLLMPYHALRWKALHRLLSRPWFGRAWTLQELVVARSSLMLCGNRAVKWEVLELAIEVCEVTTRPRTKSSTPAPDSQLSSWHPQPTTGRPTISTTLTNSPPPAASTAS